jgi:hypothetical protein
VNPLIQLKRTTPAFLIALLIVCSGLSPKAQAVIPAPDGGYPGQNTAEGDNALLNLTSGIDNTAIGFEALLSNATSNANTATGAFALLSNTDGVGNTATGAGALQNNTTGGSNTAYGFAALMSNTTGNDNTVNGEHALYRNTTGSGNTVDGNFALNSNTTGNLNTAVGYTALNSNSGNFNIALGAGAGNNLTTGDNNIDIGNVGRPRESNRIRIGTVGTQKRTFIAGISGVTVAGGVGVTIDSNGQLGTMTSSERFKDEIKSMDKASEAILALKPVTFHYKRELDPARIPQFGLVAEQVANVNPDLVARDAEGKVYSVRYEAVNAMLLNEFLKEHRRVQRLEAALAAMDRRLKTQDAKIKRVNDKVELIKPAPLTVLNDQ